LDGTTINWTVDSVESSSAGSISLVGFGIDSFIEVTSGSVLLRRMSVDANVQRRERNERLALKIVGACFLALAAYIACESTMGLSGKKAPEHIVPGIVLACVFLVVHAAALATKAKSGKRARKCSNARGR